MISAQRAAQQAAARNARVAASQVPTPKRRLRRRTRKHCGPRRPLQQRRRASRCATSALRTSMAARAPAASTARVSSCTSYAQVGVSLPHNTVAQWSYSDSVSVSRSQLQPGDLVFFYGLGHVGIYVGGGTVHPRAAHRVRRQDRQPQRLVRCRVRRRQAHPGLARVQLLDLGREVLVDDPAA